MSERGAADRLTTAQCFGPNPGPQRFVGPQCYKAVVNCPSSGESGLCLLGRSSLPSL
jgi:hypothetical protein